jgi:hypothetical protein
MEWAEDTGFQQAGFDVCTAAALCGLATGCAAILEVPCLGMYATGYSRVKVEKKLGRTEYQHRLPTFMNCELCLIEFCCCSCGICQQGRAIKKYEQLKAQGAINTTWQPLPEVGIQAAHGTAPGNPPAYNSQEPTKTGF